MHRILLFTCCLFICCQAYSQSKRTLHCGYSPCTPQQMTSFEHLLLQKVAKDTTAAYHLLANYYAVNKNNIDSAIYYLEKVELRDKNLINNLYTYSTWKTEQQGKQEHHYFVGRSPILMDLFVDLEWINQHYESINGSHDDYEDPFIKKLNSLDQDVRKEILAVEKSINHLNNENNRLAVLNAKLDSLYHVMKMNDKLVRKLLLEKMENDNSYFNRTFTSQEKLCIKILMYHSGEDLIDLEELLLHLNKYNIIEVGALRTIVGRHYCVRYNRSPIDGSPHCNFESEIVPIFNKEFPKISLLLAN